MIDKSEQYYWKDQQQAGFSWYQGKCCTLCMDIYNCHGDSFKSGKELLSYEAYIYIHKGGSRKNLGERHSQ